MAQDQCNVPKEKEKWMIENGAEPNCKGKFGDDLTDYQTGDKHFCCEFSGDDVCTVTAPRKMRRFMFDTGDATLHKCGKSGNLDPTTPVELQLEYIEPYHPVNILSSYAFLLEGRKVGILWRYRRIKRIGS